jgi:hypothetical protein
MLEHKRIASWATRYAKGIRTGFLIFNLPIIVLAISLSASTRAAAQQAEQTEIIEWGNGGNPYFRYICGGGRVLIGLQGSAGVLIDSVQAVCGKMEGGRLVGTAQPEGPVFGGMGGSIRQTAGCAHSITKAQIARNKFDPYVGAIAFPCPGARPGQSTEIRGSGELGGDFRSVSCPSGTVAVGIAGRDGRFLDAFGLLCGPQPVPATEINNLVGQEISFQSYNFPDRFIRHRNSLGFVETIPDELGKNDATFKIVPGLAGRCVSFESHNYPNHFLRHQASRLKLAQRSDDQLFRQDATFCMVSGLADSAGTSFESVNYPGHYLRHKNFELWLDRYDGTEQFRKDATFRATQPGGRVNVR